MIKRFVSRRCLFFIYQVVRLYLRHKMPLVPTYTEDNLKFALAAVRQRRWTVSKAAKEFGIPKSTLSYKVHNKHRKKDFGPEKQLREDEELALVNYLQHMASHGFPCTRAMTRCYIQEIIRRADREVSFNTEKGPSDRWFRKFLKRNPQLTERKPEHQDRLRTTMSTPTVIMTFFQFLLGVLTEYGVLDKASRIFNCDETGFSGKEMARAKVIGSKGSHIFRQRVTTTDHITAHLCIAADGRFLPTMVIFQGSLPHRKYDDGIPDSWLFAYSESGYMDGDLFFTWFTKLFIPNCGSDRPVVLVLDNHDSHVTLKVIEAARANDIVLVGLPGHTTHLLQPLDVKVIGPLKGRFSNMAANLGFGRSSLVVGKSKFPVVLKYAIDQSTPGSIQEAFAATGICPYNKNAVNKNLLVNDPLEDEQNTNEGRSNATCLECGAFLVNPLVTRGLIPERLADVLIPPSTKPSVGQKRKRVVAEGRVISGEEMLRQLKNKEEQEQLRQEEAARRQKERVIRKEIKQKEDEEKRAKRQRRGEERQKKMDELREKQEEKKRLREEKDRAKKGKTERVARLAAEMYTCGVCDERGRVDDERKGIFWFGCDESMCGKWYHEMCLSVSEREYVVESLREGGEEWYCSRCKPWLYEE